MIVGIGTDLVELARIEKSLQRFGERFAKRVLVETELTEYRQAKAQVAFLGKRFAAKEAISKVLGTGMRQGVSFSCISVKHTESGKPTVELSDAALKVAQDRGIVSWHLSISDENQYAVAFAVAEGEPS